MPGTADPQGALFARMRWNAPLSAEHAELLRGWRVIHFSEADQREWDDFESTFRAGRQEWLLANADDSRALEIREWLDTRERQYVDVYRGLLGFAYLVLAR